MIFQPKKLNELCLLLNKKDENTYLIAGGTDLIIKLKQDKITDYNIIDITKVEELKTIKENEKYLYLGSTLTVNELENISMIKEKYRALYQASNKLGSTQIRNIATIGGNIANASQSADLVISLCALNASVEIINSKEEKKIVKIEDFIVGRGQTILKIDEVISAILIPKDETINVFGKVGARELVTISKINCAINIKVKENKVCWVRVFLGAVGIRPLRAKIIENVFLNKFFKDIDLKKLQEAGSREVLKAIPTRSSRFYKKEAIQGLLEDMLEELFNE